MTLTGNHPGQSRKTIVLHCSNRFHVKYIFFMFKSFQYGMTQYCFWNQQLNLILTHNSIQSCNKFGGNTVKAKGDDTNDNDDGEDDDNDNYNF